MHPIASEYAFVPRRLPFAQPLMPTSRFFCPYPLSPHTRIALPESIAHHALRVLRLRQDEVIVLFDGSGGEYPGVLHIEGKAAYAELGQHDPRDAEPAGALTLVQGLPSGDKMDWIVEKAVELGVRRLAPVAAQRSVLQLTGARLEKRLAHWRRISVSASEQCGRNRIMQVDDPVTLEQWLARPSTGLRALCHPEAGRAYADTLRSHAGLLDLSLLVGPEGGWTEAEFDSAIRGGAQAVTFGPRVLRTETAGLALVSAATALLGWN